MLRHKPIVCVIDSESNVELGWRRSLGDDADLLYFCSHLDYFEYIAQHQQTSEAISCFVIGRYCREQNFDIINSDIPENIRKTSSAPLFLNWQGYITKDELRSKFDGKLFHRYGVKWQTLRIRLAKAEYNQRDFCPPLQPSPEKVEEKPRIRLSRPERCRELLQIMATRASGDHREKIDYLAKRDRQMGIMLLEKLYNRLLTDKDRPESCPSRYINSSPVIAQRILHDALFG